MIARAVVISIVVRTKVAFPSIFKVHFLVASENPFVVSDGMGTNVKRFQQAGHPDGRYWFAVTPFPPRGSFDL